MNVQEYNSAAWDRNVEKQIKWSIPVSPEEIEKARGGEWEIVLTPLKKVPREWFGDVSGKDILCLASGGGQQAPILAAAGARASLRLIIPRDSSHRINSSPTGIISKFAWKKATRRICRALRTRASI